MSNYVKVGRESSFGTASGTYTPIKVTSVSDDVDRGVLIEETIDEYLATSAYGGALAISGSIEGNLRSNQFRNLIYSVMGDEAGTGYPYTYSFGIPQPITIRIGEDTGSSVETQYVGGVINSMNLSFEAKEFVKGTFNFIAKNVTDTSTTFDNAVTYVNEEPLIFYRAGITFAGDSTIGVKSLSLDIDRGVDTDQFVLGDFTLRRIAMTSQTAATGSMTLVESEYDELKRAMYGDDESTSISACNPVGQGTLIIECKTVCGDSSMLITCPVAILTKSARSFSGKSEVEKTVDYTIISDPDTPFTIVVSNTSVTGVDAAFTSKTDGLVATFTDTSTGSPTYWYWEFGDGEYSYEQNPVHTYASAKTYSVTLTVDKQDSGEDSVTNSVTVSAL